MQPGLYRSFERRGTEYVPHYLTHRDHGWLELLLAEHARYVGAQRREWNERLKLPFGVRVPRVKLGWACSVLERLGDSKPPAEPSAEQVRHVLFRCAAALRERSLAIEQAARRLDVPPELLLERLLSDLPDERPVGSIPAHMSAALLALTTNAELAAAFLKHSRHVSVEVRGSPRLVLRQARRLGLVCVVRRAGPDLVRLEVSGPLALFRRTRVYGRALASLLPSLAGAEHYELRAECELHGAHSVVITIRAGDPLAMAADDPAPEQLDRRFLERVRRRLPGWRAIPEPGLIAAGSRLLAPDFELVSRRDPERRWFVELLGFWTPAELETRLVELRAAGLANYLLCVERAKNCGVGGAPGLAHVIDGSRGSALAGLAELLEAPLYSTMP